jgi:hypothetical protein
MEAQMQTNKIKQMARETIVKLEAYREVNRGARTPQLARCRGILAFCEGLPSTAKVTITTDDYLAITEHP